MTASASTSRSPLATLGPQSLPALAPIDPSSVSRVDGEAVKRIESDEDVHRWKASVAHEHIVLFASRLCEAAVGLPTRAKPPRGEARTTPITSIIELLDKLSGWIDDIAPRAGPQRFGNLAFRDWGAKLEAESASLHRRLLPEQLHGFIPELQSYLIGGFGSWIRLDYGSGHELSFVAWLCFLDRLAFFSQPALSNPEHLVKPQQSESDLALLVFPRYLALAWKLQDAYGLEPAGSHGVWGLDDYHFLPYAIGAAQLRLQHTYTPLQTSRPSHRPAPAPAPTPEGLLAFIPAQSSSSSSSSSDPRASKEEQAPPFANLYTSSIARIHAKKRGPFFEHSPILNDVATTVPNWVKVHQGMLKMWDAECLGKRPVVQHFVFGRVGFVWEGQGEASPRKEEQKAAAPQITKSAGMPAPTGAPWAATAAPLTAAALPPPLSRPRPLGTAAGIRGADLSPMTRAPAAGVATLASTGSAAASSSPFGRLSRPTTTGPLSKGTPPPTTTTQRKQ
ncbi:PTPA-domain-containing protein [Acaromyces ingoldii]|uniref:Serine/threonine-protein phosphatase 2A activator n=1 Tax=Acaromyces ingoldii TaxID=215250 RepID=A0A316YQ02_9BASI|nr:PTPA-domain-containing protein [Acaromyces ingoldii]PWN89825.1 PTPA-domain-containing protein [Acaromyces ingoldii]